MKVSVRVFAGLKDILGTSEAVLELGDGATVGDLRQRLSEEYPAVAPFLSSVVCAVDEEYVTPDRALSDGDEIALIPPVSGGAPDGALFRVTTDLLDPGPLVEAVRKDESGAVVLFYGVARNHSEGRAVQALEYEAHVEMAEKKLREVAEEVRARFPVTGIGMLHRTGRVAIGEASLLVAVSAEHRSEAFEACHYAVDRIKQVVPVWKKEIWEEGGGDWVAGHPVDDRERAEAKPGS